MSTSISGMGTATSWFWCSNRDNAAWQSSVSHAGPARKAVTTGKKLPIARLRQSWPCFAVGQAIRIQLRQRMGILGYAGSGPTQTLAKLVHYTSEKIAHAENKSP